MAPLSPDRPASDPKRDLFGHAPFAEALAKSIQTYSNDEGLVLGLYGPWGSGKSTVLAYVVNYLKELPEKEQPLIVPFNPWWFSGQDNLARAFLGQLQAVLPAQSKDFAEIGQLLGDFAEGVGGLIDLTGYTAGWGQKIGALISGSSKRTPKDVPALKSKISDFLLNAKRRVLVVIDDIDRLTPDETRQLFTVIKGLADFPHIIYLLAFDREVAAQAISVQTGMPGERYLEKIIQVPFELPPVDRTALQAALFRGLDEIIKDTPEGLFDSSYWVNVYHDGLDKLFTVPRDVVRFINTLSVTYPAVRGEVNTVDYIALEALRVFVPSLYDIIRTNPQWFAGHRSTSSGRNETEQDALRQSWLANVPPSFRPKALELLQRIFPKLEQSIHGADWLKTWRLSLRACHPDIFPTYFRFYVPPSAIRKSEMDAIMELVRSPQALAAHFIAAAQYKMPDGRSRVRALLDRLSDYVEASIPIHDVPAFTGLFLNDGDRLIVETDVRAMFDFGNDVLVFRLVYNLVKRLQPGDRLAVLKAAFEDGNALYSQSFFLRAILDDVAKGKTSDLLLPVTDLEVLKTIWVNKVRSMKGKLLSHPQLRSLLLVWQMWGDQEEVRSWCHEAIQSDDGLFQFLERFTYNTSANKMGDWAVTNQMRLNPKWLEDFVDTSLIATRLASLREKGLVPAEAEVNVAQFFKELKMLQEGKNPDSPFSFEEV